MPRTNPEKKADAIKTAMLKGKSVRKPMVVTTSSPKTPGAREESIKTVGRVVVDYATLPR